MSCFDKKINVFVGRRLSELLQLKVVRTVVHLARLLATVYCRMILIRNVSTSKTLSLLLNHAATVLLQKRKTFPVGGHRVLWLVHRLMSVQETFGREGTWEKSDTKENEGVWNAAANERLVERTDCTAATDQWKFIKTRSWRKKCTGTLR